MNTLARCALFAMLLSVTHAAPANAQIVVFAPHPDDEALMASGIINRARTNGDTIKVVVATNGDCETFTAQQRQPESVAAMGVLGLSASDVIFLGYPDCGLRPMYFSFTSPTSRYTSAAGRNQTYGFHGLGSADYHTYIYGAPAPYNKPSVLQDIRTVLLNYRPQEIYVTSPYDAHSDHSTLNFFVVEAVAAYARENASFQPTIHESIVHEPCEGVCNPNYHWPMPSFTPTQNFTAPPFLSMSAHAWADVESVVVPTPMQSTSTATNTKYQALAQYQSQSSAWLFSFVKLDEIFWRSELWSNLAWRATASASSVGSGTPADRIADGSVTGGAHKPDGEWVSNGQLAGAWAQLTWSSARQITRVILHDRPDTSQNVTGGTLSFSDGSSITVGSLPSNGVGHTVTFAQKNVTWVRFTVTSAAGSAAGLAEMQVFGPTTTKLAPYVPPVNAAPILNTGPFANPPSISDAATSSLTATASDSNGDPLAFTWVPAQGTITGSGGTVTFAPPIVATTTTVRVTLIVADGRGGKDTEFVDILVSPSGQPANVARTATATASSQSASQPAARAIDGIVDGYPGDSSREWASAGQLAGAWIQLTWPSAQTVVRAVLYDRINSEDQVLAGTLRFSDGSTVAVGALPNNGAGLTVNFAAKTITWVRFEVTNAQGWSVGLAEFEVFSGQGGGTNAAPQITSGPTANPATITDISTSSLSVSATDPDGDTLTYSWSAAAGSLSSTTGSPVTFTPPRVTSPITVRIDVQVTDGRGGAAAGFVNVTVNPTPASANLALVATATASSEDLPRSQGAAKAIDGMVSGYPTDSTREWVTLGQLGGAWIQLTWSSAQNLARVVLHDRINSEDQILSGVLRFSDGTTTTVGALPNDGAGLTVSFPARFASWVRFEIASARGWSTGLAEFEVFAAETGGSNAPPQITSGPTATPSTLDDGQTSSISVVASDPTGEPLTYSWQTTGGGIVGSGSTITFVPTRVTTSSVFRVTVVVSDPVGNSVSRFVDVTVTPSNAPLNLAPYATPSASSERSQQGAVKAIDGVISGYPTNPAAEWSTSLQLAGAWIQLTWSGSQSISRVSLYDRINSDDQVLGGTLRFSNGTTVPVGTLPNDGAALVVNFSPRSVTWIRFEITSARGNEIGLAEFEVFAAPPSGSNTAPQITSGPTATPSTITDLLTSSVTVSATDANGDPLTYSWQTNGGTITGTGQTVTFTPPRLTSTTTFRVTVEVSDPNGGLASGFVDVVVNPSNTPINLALSATATASAENTGRDQTAAKATDGVVDGYPTDLTREWAAPGQLAGSWIQLNWSTARSVTRVVLHDRINGEDQILGGILRFSDGSTIAVGTLPNNGAGLEINFTARSVTWVRLEITSARGWSIGLAEFEVY